MLSFNGIFFNDVTKLFFTISSHNLHRRFKWRGYPLSMLLITALTSSLKTLARGEPESLTAELQKPASGHFLSPLLMAIVGGCAAYGFAIGLWRAPLQGLFVAVKMPLLIFMTLTVNGLLNGMLGLLLGSGLSFRQTIQACLMSFAIFSLIVGSLSPIAIAMVLDAPSPNAPEAAEWYRAILLTHTAIIAFAGIVANHKLLRLLQVFSGSASAGWRTLVAWLAGNLFVGAQLSYNLRPFFGNPHLPIEFLRSQPFQGSFYEAVWSLTVASLPRDLGATVLSWGIIIALSVAIFLIFRAIIERGHSSSR
ncbi:hypothetical protein BH11VER1_BH11VER1_17520 [soil metagenome]